MFQLASCHRRRRLPAVAPIRLVSTAETARKRKAEYFAIARRLLSANFASTIPRMSVCRIPAKMADSAWSEGRVTLAFVLFRTISSVEIAASDHVILGSATMVVASKIYHLLKGLIANVSLDFRVIDAK